MLAYDYLTHSRVDAYLPCPVLRTGSLSSKYRSMCALKPSSTFFLLDSMGVTTELQKVIKLNSISEARGGYQPSGCHFHGGRYSRRCTYIYTSSDGHCGNHCSAMVVRVGGWEASRESGMEIQCITGHHGASRGTSLKDHCSNCYF